MKKLYLFMVLLLLVSPLLMAAGGKGVHIQGTITDINKTNLTITVGDILVQVTNKTLIYECTNPGEHNQDCTEIEFKDLTINDRVGVTGQYVGEVLYAKKIVVH